jgi:hypothetical protein
MPVLRVIGSPAIGLLRVDDHSPRSITVTGIGADRDRPIIAAVQSARKQTIQVRGRR